jgi:hypothetical protein
MRYCSLLVTVAVLSAAACAHGAIIVDASGGGDYLTIQDGINAASEGDSVIVRPGIYAGDGNRNLQFGGTNMTLTSLGNTATTIIDCEGEDRAFNLFRSGEDTTCIVRGFTIRDGDAPVSDGGAVLAYDAALTLEECVIEDCAAPNNGGGVYLADNTALGGAIVKDCVFRNNHTGARAGGLFVYRGSAKIIACTFEGNWTTGEGHASLGGGAICLDQIDATTFIASSTFVGNSSVQNASGIHAYPAEDVYVRTSIFAFGDGPALTSDGSDFAMIDYNILYENEGGDTYPGDHPDNLVVDPLFCGVTAGDFTLCANSPCLPGVNSWGELVGAYDTGCESCDSPVEDASWGRIKALWR